MSARHALLRRRLRPSVAALAVAATAAGLIVANSAPGSAANSTADARNIVANSNFASPALARGYEDMAAPGSIPSWTATGTIDLISPSWWQEPAGDPSGTQSVDLSGLSEGSVSQTLATNAGWTYSGSFELAGNPQGAPTTKTGTLTVGNLSLPFTFSTSETTVENMGWQQVDFSFTAASSSTVLTLASTTPGDYGPVVTDVDVDPPLPPQIGTDPAIRVLQTTPSGTPVTFEAPSATDPNSGEALPVTCVPDSGSVFPPGTTTVTCTATSPFGPSASSQFTVTVVGFSSDCRARALAFDGPSPLVIDPANNPLSPCLTDSAKLLGANVPLVPGVLGVKLNAIDDETLILPGALITTDSASSDVASVTVTAAGLTLTATGLHSQATATLNEECIGTKTASSYLASLVINGKRYTIGGAPLTITLPLRISISINEKSYNGNDVTARALYITFPDKRYDIALGESQAGLNCPS